MKRAGVAAAIVLASALVVGPATVAPRALVGMPVVDSATAVVPSNSSISASYLAKIRALKKPLKTKSGSPTFAASDLKDVDVGSSLLAHVFVGGQNRANGPVQGLHYVSTPQNRNHVTDAHVSTVLDNRGGRAGPSTGLSSQVRSAAIPQGPRDRNGVFRAWVWHRTSQHNSWRQKAGGSTMFPQDWSVGDVLDTFKVAVDSGRYVKRERGVTYYRANVTNPRGGGSMSVEYTENDEGRLVTFYPIYETETETGAPQGPVGAAKGV